MTTTRDDLDAWFAKADDVLEWHPGYGDAFEWHAPEPNFDCPEIKPSVPPNVAHLDGESRQAYLYWFGSSRPDPNFDCPPLPDTATRLATFAQREGLDGESARALYAVSAMLGFRSFGEVLSAALGRVSVEFRVLR